MSIHTASCKVLGSQLNAKDQKYVLSHYSFRFTGNHTPAWAKEPMPNGNEYPVQFKNDQEWLANTYFAVNTQGDLDHRYNECESRPTWPNNPELHKNAA